MASPLTPPPLNCPAIKKGERNFFLRLPLETKEAGIANLVYQPHEPPRLQLFGLVKSPSNHERS